MRLSNREMYHTWMVWKITNTQMRISSFRNFPIAYVDPSVYRWMRPKYSGLCHARGNQSTTWNSCTCSSGPQQRMNMWKGQLLISWLQKIPKTPSQEVFRCLGYVLVLWNDCSKWRCYCFLSYTHPIAQTPDQLMIGRCFCVFWTVCKFLWLDKAYCCLRRVISIVARLTNHKLSPHLELLRNISC